MDASDSKEILAKYHQSRVGSGYVSTKLHDEIDVNVYYIYK